MPLLLLILCVAGALIGNGLDGSLGAGLGLLVGAVAGVALEAWSA